MHKIARIQIAVWVILSTISATSMIRAQSDFSQTRIVRAAEVTDPLPLGSNSSRRKRSARPADALRPVGHLRRTIQDRGWGLEPPADALRPIASSNVVESVVDELEPELEAILQCWNIESDKINSLSGKFSRSDFDHDFAVETVSNGQFILETRHKGCIDEWPFKLDTKAMSKKVSRKGVHYSLKSRPAEHWGFTGDSILVWYEGRTDDFREVLIPEDLRGTDRYQVSFAFLFGIQAEEARRRFKVSLLKDNTDEATILFIPRTVEDHDRLVPQVIQLPFLSNFKSDLKVKIVLDKKTFIPSKVHLIQGDCITVYTFDSMVVETREPTEE